MVTMMAMTPSLKASIRLVVILDISGYGSGEVRDGGLA
jgi:hypothetical protein